MKNLEKQMNVQVFGGQQRGAAPGPAAAGGVLPPAGRGWRRQRPLRPEAATQLLLLVRVRRHLGLCAAASHLCLSGYSLTSYFKYNLDYTYSINTLHIFPSQSEHSTQVVERSRQWCPCIRAHANLYYRYARATFVVP